MSFLSYPRTKTRQSVRRRPSETLIRKSLAPTQASLSPSVNPVRRSIEITSNSIKEFTIHYQRKDDSTKTIDSRHEAYYERYGFPVKPKYNARGRRFSDSTETDPDYNANEFRKLSKALNNKDSPASSRSGSENSSRRSSASSDNSQRSRRREDPSMNSLLAELEKIQGNPTVKNDDSISQDNTIDIYKSPRNENRTCFQSFSALMRQWWSSCKGFFAGLARQPEEQLQAPNLARTPSMSETATSTKKYSAPAPRGTNVTNPKQDMKKNPPTNIKTKKKSYVPNKRFPSLVTPSVTVGVVE